MGTEILRPQYCLIDELRVNSAVFPRRKPYAGNHRPCRKQSIGPEPRKRITHTEPSVSHRSTASFDYSKPSLPKNLVVGQAAIVKRGQSSLDPDRKSEFSTKKTVYGTERLGPKPEMVPKQIRIADAKLFSPRVAVRSDVYAGSSCSISPSPSALPLPSFSKKKDQPALFDDSATKDLRRILGLD
ncbi:PREDICTED: uncharacterized protein LOC104586882 [Nelumbo nucifera]|uniref:Uncharacterized protein LOC104586882 n=1 Tax=Nelumbo nucifera TaxID=4432 RepID=A0A1U7Z579_NELNU|nr:PREDICTED: uncharacterized protein LOC104586882 [Nelumbo nucifera]